MTPSFVSGALQATTLRTRLFLVMVALNLVAAALTGTIVVLTARSATRSETEASMHLAADLVNEAMRTMRNMPPSLILHTLQAQFSSIRHVRIELPGSAAPAGESGGPAGPERSATPRWFSRLIGPVTQVQDVPLLVHNRRIGDVRIVSDPGDEIGEAWQYAQAILLTALVLDALVLILLFVVLDRMLQPLTELISGLAGLEARNYAVRLPKPSLPELASIADHFNRAAATIGREQENNGALHRRLIVAQDEERRRTALDLHDEVGPCLFALDACTSSIAAAPSTIDRAELARSADEATALVRELKTINRRVLGRLRPASLGRIPLGECLQRRIEELAISTTASVSAKIGSLARSYGPSIDLTVYKCVQEGVINALRHAQARTIEVSVEEAAMPLPRGLLLSVRDDGRGLSAQAEAGLGLAGIRERAEALGGCFAVATSSSGVCLTVTLPLAADAARADFRESASAE